MIYKKREGEKTREEGGGLLGAGIAEILILKVWDWTNQLKIKFNNMIN